MIEVDAITDGPQVLYLLVPADIAGKPPPAENADQYNAECTKTKANLPVQMPKSGIVAEKDQNDDQVNKCKAKDQMPFFFQPVYDILASDIQPGQYGAGPKGMQVRKRQGPDNCVFVIDSPVGQRKNDEPDDDRQFELAGAKQDDPRPEQVKLFLDAQGP